MRRPLPGSVVAAYFWRNAIGLLGLWTACFLLVFLAKTVFEYAVDVVYPIQIHFTEFGP